MPCKIDNGNFKKYGLDPHEDQLKRGLSPLDEYFGLENPEKNGRLTFPDNNKSEVLPTEKGAYWHYYDALHKCIIDGKVKDPALSDVTVVICGNWNLKRLIESN